MTRRSAPVVEDIRNAGRTAGGWASPQRQARARPPRSPLLGAAISPGCPGLSAPMTIPFRLAVSPHGRALDRWPSAALCTDRRGILGGLPRDVACASAPGSQPRHSLYTSRVRVGGEWQRARASAHPIEDFAEWFRCFPLSGEATALVHSPGTVDSQLHDSTSCRPHAAGAAGEADACLRGADRFRHVHVKRRGEPLVRVLRVGDKQSQFSVLVVDGGVAGAAAVQVDPARRQVETPGLDGLSPLRNRPVEFWPSPSLFQRSNFTATLLGMSW